ncbi:hypothetical protein M3Y98_00400700 [Aphelenchoides besseyi]|nr:hypothetical protein M3Y98_00400700 [Aphelenchoides besseyi]KAI6202263.1 hypothetical protein M3Y96_00929700 [Aphelenchoides besseyi]
MLLIDMHNTAKDTRNSILPSWFLAIGRFSDKMGKEMPAPCAIRECPETFSDNKAFNDYRKSEHHGGKLNCRYCDDQIDLSSTSEIGRRAAFDHHMLCHRMLWFCPGKL